MVFPPLLENSPLVPTTIEPNPISDSDDEEMYEADTKAAELLRKSTAQPKRPKTQPTQEDVLQSVYRQLYKLEPIRHPTLVRLLHSAYSDTTHRGRLRLLRSVLNQSGSLADNLEQWISARLSTVREGTVVKDLYALKSMALRTFGMDLAPIVRDICRTLRSEAATQPVMKALPMTRRMLDRIAPTLEPHLRLLATLAFRTSSRLSDFDEMTWNHIAPDRDRVSVRFPATKGNPEGSPRPDHLVSLTSPDAIITEAAKRSSSALIFTQRDAERLRTKISYIKVPQTYHEFFASADPSNRVHQKFTGHSFKRGAAFHLWRAADAGRLAPQAVMSALKHKDLMTTIGYAPEPALVARVLSGETFMETAQESL